MKLKELQKLLVHRTLPSIRYKAFYYRLVANRTKTNKRYPVWKEDYFETPNVENSYWAGFIGADGCIGGNTLYVTQADIEPLENLKTALQYTGKISHRVRKQKNHEYCLNVTSQSLVEDLRNNYNIVPAKSLILTPPNITGDNALAYIVGYLDGDGHISLSHDKRNNRWNLIFGILGTESVINWMKEILNEKLNIRIRQENGNKPIWLLYGSGQYAIKTLNKLASLPLEHVRLKRKWDKLPRWIEYGPKYNYAGQ